MSMVVLVAQTYNAGNDNNHHTALCHMHHDVYSNGRT